MSNASLYQLLGHLDAPKRYLSLTIDELIIASIGFIMLALTNHKIIGAVLSLLLLSTLRYLKKGASPRMLLVLIYWYFPHGLTQFLLPRLPASHQRIWVA